MIGPTLRRAGRWLAGFITEQAPQSSVRLIAVGTAMVCAAVALGTLVFAFAHPEQAATVGALAGVITALAGVVGWALAVRKQKDLPAEPADLPSDSP